MMIGLARKRMKKDIEELERKKKSIQAYEKIAEEARVNVFSKPYTRWTAKDFKAAIKYKQGLKAPDNRKWNQSSKFDVLKTFYDAHYKGLPRLGPDEICWKPEDEEKLESMRAGKIDSVQETTMYARCLDGRKNYLLERLINLSAQSRFDIIEDATALLTHEERNKLGFKLGFLVSNEIQSDDDEDDSEHSRNISLLSTDHIPRLLTEILDEEEDIVLGISDDADSENEIDSLRSDGNCSDQSSECLSALLNNQNNRNVNINHDSRDSDSDSSSCFDFQREQYIGKESYL